MNRATVFAIKPPAGLEDAERTLHLAMFAAEGLVGRARVCIDGRYTIDPPRREIAVDTRSRVGRIISRVYAGLLLRELGEGAFSITHIDARPPETEERNFPS